MPGAEQDVYLAMAMLTTSGTDLRESFQRFATLAREAWPDAVAVERAGLFGRGPVQRITFRLHEHAYSATVGGVGIGYEIGTLSHGVVIRTDRVPAERWTADLQAEIARATDGHFQARQLFDGGTPPPQPSQE